MKEIEMKSTLLISLAAATLLQPPAQHDVSYQETTQITGGSLRGMMKLAGTFSSQARQANSPTVTNVVLHGNRMARANSHNTEVIDLDQQTITIIDHDKRIYSIMTFQQMQQAIADTLAKAKQQSNASSDKQPAASGAEMNFGAHVSSNGATRTIDGLQAREALISITMIANANDGSNAKAGMAATSEMWLVQEIPGMDELRAFSKRMAEELSVDTTANQMNGLLAAQPGGAEALADLKKETSKMQGFPVLQVTRVGVSPDGQPLPAPSVAPAPNSQTGSSTAGNITREVATDTGTQTANSEIGKLGTFGRALGSSSLGAFMRHKPVPAKTAPPAVPGSSDASGVLLESQTSIGNFSTSVTDLSSFDIPAGYKQVTSPLLKNTK
jgi:hypothetical protein